MANIWTAASEGDFERVKDLVQAGKSPPTAHTTATLIPTELIPPIASLAQQASLPPPRTRTPTLPCTQLHPGTTLTS